MVLMENELSADDLEMQQDHFDYYATVPIVHWAVSSATYNNEGSYEGIK